jgi:hypothetical protein
VTLPKLRPGTAGFFSGGRAPDCWQRDIARPAAAPRAIERACRWLEELAGAPPRLRSEPLLGRCLPELLDAPPVTDEPAPAQEPRQPRRQAKPAAPATARPPRPEKLPAGKQEHAQQSGPAGQPARASQALLEQHAAPRKGRRRGAAEYPAKGPAGKRPAVAQKPAHGKKEQAEAPADAGGDQGAWAGRLAERVRRGWTREGDAARQPRRELPDLPGERPGGGLAAQWERLLSGETAPAGKLERLAQAAAGKGARSRRTGDKGAKGRPAAGDETATRALKDGPAEERPAGRNPANGRSRSGASGRRRAGRGWMGGWHGDEAAHEAAHEEEVAVEPALVHEMGRYEPVDERSLAATRFQPPQMAERLPPLHPPRPNGLAIPAAAAAAARSARQEAEAAGDDLDELARKLNKILEEESRRFGIDV